MELKIATDTDAELWDSLVEQSPNGTLFHTWKWLKLIEKYSVLKKAGRKARARLDPLILTENGIPVGIYPLFFFRAMGMTYCYSPYSQEDTHYLGPLFPKLTRERPEAAQIFLVDVQRTVDRFIKKERKSNYVQISTPPGFDDCRPFKWAGYRVEPRYTYSIDISSGTEDVWNSFAGRLRQGIKKAGKDGITVTEGDKDDAYFIYDLLRKRNHAKFSKEYLGSVYDEFHPDHMKIFIAKKGSERISGAIALLFKDRMSGWNGMPRVQGSNVNELLRWESIKWAGAHGYRTYEIIGADDYPLFPFKRKFNGRIEEFYQMKWYSPAFYVAMSLYTSIFKGQRNQIEEE